MDAAVRAIYAQRQITLTDRLSGMSELAARLGLPEWRLKKRAAELGVSRIKEKGWTEAEVRLLKRWSHLTPGHIAKKFREAGFKRTVVAVTLQRNRMKLKMNSSGFYSANAVANGLGVDGHRVTNWIIQGALKAQRKGTKRKADQGSDHYLIARADLRAFIFANPDAFVLGKVDQLWFLHVVSNGEVAIAGKPTKRNQRQQVNNNDNE
jgi:hypothetical protein